MVGVGDEGKGEGIKEEQGMEEEGRIKRRGTAGSCCFQKLP